MGLKWINGFLIWLLTWFKLHTHLFWNLDNALGCVGDIHHKRDDRTQMLVCGWHWNMESAKTIWPTSIWWLNWIQPTKNSQIDGADQQKYVVLILEWVYNQSSLDAIPEKHQGYLMNRHLRVRLLCQAGATTYQKTWAVSSPLPLMVKPI